MMKFTKFTKFALVFIFSLVFTFSKFVVKAEHAPCCGCQGGTCRNCWGSTTAESLCPGAGQPCTTTADCYPDDPDPTGSPDPGPPITPIPGPGSEVNSSPVSITSDVEGEIINASKNVVLPDKTCQVIGDKNAVYSGTNVTKLNPADVALHSQLKTINNGEDYLDSQNAWDYFPWLNPARGLTNLTYASLVNGSSHRTDYEFNLVPWHSGSYNLSLDIDNINSDKIIYSCLCPSVEGQSNKCFYPGVVPPTRKWKPDGTLEEWHEGYNFFITARDNTNGDWWQVTNGNVYSGGGITSLIPNTSDNSDLDGHDYDSCSDDTGCIPRIIKSTAEDSFLELSNASEKSGIPLTKEGGEISYGENPNADYTHRPIANESYQGVKERAAKKENYDYFERLYEERSGSDLTDGANCPNETSCNIYLKGDVEIDLDGDLSEYTNGESKKVFFIDGNLTIKDTSDEKGNKLEVAEGKFLAFIISGDLIIEGSVGYNKKISAGASYFADFGGRSEIWSPFDSNNVDDKIKEINLDGNVQGMFIVDGDIEVRDNDEWQPRKFIGEGSFISFSEVQLNRKFSDKSLKEDDDPSLNTGNTVNNYHAPVNFKYRPDLVANTPEWMKHTKKVYQEFN